MQEELLIVSVIFLFAYVILIAACIIGWIRVPYFKVRSNIPSTKISVIIGARNESENIEKCLAHLIKQNYPNELLEIIIVDDNSEDATAALVEKTAKNCAQIKLISLKPENQTGATKKRAIAEGIKACSGSLIVTTDADCLVPPNWLKTIVSYYEEFRPKMIVGPVAFYGEKNIFEKMQAIEFAGLVASGAAACHLNKPLLCNGANLAYEKKAFIKVSGFEGISNSLSGDDVLLMFKFERSFPGEIKFLKSGEAVVLTSPKKTIKDFLQQRLRWASKSISSVNKTYIFTGVIVTGINFLLLILLMLSGLNMVFFKFFLLLFVTKCIIDFLFLFLASSFFNKKRFLLFFIPQQLLYIFYTTTIVVLSQLVSYSWKGRRENKND